MPTILSAVTSEPHRDSLGRNGECTRGSHEEATRHFKDVTVIQQHCEAIVAQRNEGAVSGKVPLGGRAETKTATVCISGQSLFYTEKGITGCSDPLQIPRGRGCMSITSHSAKPTPLPRLCCWDKRKSENPV